MTLPQKHALENNLYSTNIFKHKDRVVGPAISTIHQSINKWPDLIDTTLSYGLIIGISLHPSPGLSHLHSQDSSEDLSLSKWAIFIAVAV